MSAGDQLAMKQDTELELQPLTPQSQDKADDDIAPPTSPEDRADDAVAGEAQNDALLSRAATAKRPAWKIKLAAFMDHGVVEAFILLVILANVGTMCAQIDDLLLDLVICLFFTLEMLLRVLACGFYYEDDAYLRDSWNRLDCFLTLTGWLGFILPIKLSVLRVVRLLRLQRLESFSGIRDILSSIAAAVPSLIDVCTLLLFAFSIYGIVGISMYSGALKNRCYVKNEEDLMSFPELYCALDTDSFPEAKPCPEHMECKLFENPQGTVAEEVTVSIEECAVQVINRVSTT